MSENFGNEINKTKVRVRYNEIDKQGIAHNSVYHIWFELARWDFARKVLNINEKDIEKNNVYIVVYESYCQYISPAKYDDLLVIEIYLEETNTSKFTLHYRIIRPDDKKLIAKGKTTHVFIKRDGTLLLNMPFFFSDQLKKALKKYPLLVIKKG